MTEKRAAPMTGWAVAGSVLLLALLAGLAVRAAWTGEEGESPVPGKSIPYEEGTVPPRGWILVDIEGEGRMWVDPAALTPAPSRQELSPEQVERIRAFKEILGDNDPTTLEEAVVNFSRDRDPDKEIAIWEHIADVWSTEVATRGVEGPSDAKLLYMAVVGCSLVGPTPEALLAWNPRLKAVPDLAGLTTRYRGDHGSADQESD